MESPFLHPGERLDEVNYRVRLIQKTEGLTFGTDALLLAAFLHARPDARGVELGGGSGIISLLCLAREKLAHIDCIEIQRDYADLIERNAALNGMSDRLSVHCSDVRQFATEGRERGQFDVVFTNPPYLRTGDGVGNRACEKSMARHEENGGIADFVAAGARLLRYGGRFFCVWRPERMTDLLYSLRKNRLEPKRLTLVHTHKGSVPSLLLLEAVSGGGAGLRITRPLFLYRDSGSLTYTEDMTRVFEEGILPQGRE